MNIFLDYLVVTALFALVLLPAVVGAVRDRRIDRQLRDAERGEVLPARRESAARPVAATRRLPSWSWAKAQTAGRP
ncbi:hypothetical protein B7C62_24955 [Kitasatospora albolonga]|uniref:Uncharacterized protein n=1 Tax=Kitasatospora albolonga TaxID=68173 RepID=A0ABC8BY09_9ACTN|nr:hypothetical protein B7C62_24955 [Kitasatospora albolonga]